MELTKQQQLIFDTIVKMYDNIGDNININNIGYCFVVYGEKNSGKSYLYRALKTYFLKNLKYCGCKYTDTKFKFNVVNMFKNVYLFEKATNRDVVNQVLKYKPELCCYHSFKVYFCNFRNGQLNTKAGIRIFVLHDYHRVYHTNPPSLLNQTKAYIKHFNIKTVDVPLILRFNPCPPEGRPAPRFT